MNELECPHCDTRDFDSDWVYNQDLYTPDIDKQVDCPKCKEKFWVHTWESIAYECTKDEP